VLQLGKIDLEIKIPVHIINLEGQFRPNLFHSPCKERKRERESKNERKRGGERE